MRKELKCYILPCLDHEEIIKIRCIASAGNGNCGKRQCRGETRKEVVSKLAHESTEFYRSKKAAEMMKEGDSKKPPLLFEANILRNAKYEFQQKKYRDPKPITALSKFKRCPECQNVVRYIGSHPIKVFFWSPHQIRLYNYMMKVSDCRLCLDATGKLAKYVIHVDGEKSQTFFLYLGVLFSLSGQFAVFGMFSERQDTVTISTWLMRWIQSDAEYPKEVVCDSSKALLNACCWAFTGIETIEIYAEACMEDELPRTYIRIDVAHDMKNWADFLKNEKKEVKRFYLFAIGRLILCRNQIEATRIIEALLFVSKSETAGDGATSLKTSIDFIKNLIKNAASEIEEIVDSIFQEDKNDDSEQEEESVQDNSRKEKKGLFKNWSLSIEKEVDLKIKNEISDDLNPRHCPKFAARLLKHMQTIPVWSCIRRDNFKYGRVLASSAPVESEFKTIKKQVLTNEEKIDVAVESVVKCYNGKLKLIDCSNRSKNKVSVDSQKESQGKKKHSIISDKIHSQVVSSVVEASVDQSPLKNISSQFHFNVATTFLACKNGDLASGSRACIVCGSNIHLLDGCSTRIEEEEGYGERRICIPCSESSTKDTGIALTLVENWRDLGRTKKKRQFFYLTKNNQDLNDMIISSKSRTLPILKNGIDHSLRLVTWEKTKLSLPNTCPLDSIFQIILVAVTDSEKVHKYVKEHRSICALFEMVLEVSDKNIQLITYQRRAEIFLNYFNKELNPNLVESIDCSCNIVSLANFLFKDSPSFQEASVCRAGCQPRINALPSITISDNEIDKPLGGVIKDDIILPSVQCRQNNCKDTEDKEIHKIGDMTIIGIDVDRKKELESFAKSCICPKTGETCSILGLIDYKGPSVMRRTSKPIGHYVAISRRNTNWIVYDGMKKKASAVENDYKLSAELLIYFRQ